MKIENPVIANLHRSYFTVFPQLMDVTPRAHGIDLSKYDLFFRPETAISQLDFVIQRVSYRSTRDEAFLQLVPGVMQVPIRGGYHYLNSDTDWRYQADRFISFVAGYDYHFFACDFEGAFNILSQAFAYSAWQWIHYVQDRTGKPVLIYTSPSLYSTYITPSASRYGVNWNTIDLWTAQWFFTPNPNGSPSMPTGRTAGWRFWQYTNKGDGTRYGVARPTACDLNVFNGSVQQLREWLQIGETTPPPDPDTPPQGGSMQYRVVVDAKLWGQYSGGIFSNQIDTLRAGTTVTGNAAVGGVVRLTSPAGYTKAIWLTPIATPPPDPEPEPAPTLTHTIEVYDDGSLKIDGNPYP